ncbi:MAG: hypothetical protein AAF621_06510 [Pseudomonadota bacterium]
MPIQRQKSILIHLIKGCFLIYVTFFYVSGAHALTLEFSSQEKTAETEHKDNIGLYVSFLGRPSLHSHQDTLIRPIDNEDVGLRLKFNMNIFDLF